MMRVAILGPKIKRNLYKNGWQNMRRNDTENSETEDDLESELEKTENEASSSGLGSSPNRSSVVSPRSNLSSPKSQNSLPLPAGHQPQQHQSEDEEDHDPDRRGTIVPNGKDFVAVQKITQNLKMIDDAES